MNADATGDKIHQLPPPPVHYFKRDGSPVQSLSFIAYDDRLFLAQGSQDGNLTVWNLQTCEPWWTVSAHSAACQTVLQLDCGRLLTQGRNDSISLWDVNTTQPIVRIPFSHHGFCSVAVASDGRVACPSEPAANISLLDLRSGRHCGQLPSPAQLGSVMQLRALAGGGCGLLAVHEAGALQLWEAGQTAPTARLQLASDDKPMCVDVSADGRGLVGTSGRTVAAFRLTDDRQLAAADPLPLTNAGVAAARVRRDGRVGALGCWDHRLRVVSWRKRTLLAVLEHHSNTVQCVEFATGPVALWKANALLASGSSDGTVALWKIYDS